MTSLRQCDSCRGFLPRGAREGTSCPHCAKRVWTKTLCAVGATLGAGSLAFTLMACYGIAPCPDGTRDCHRPPPTGAEGGPSDTPSAAPNPAANAAPDGGK